MKELLGLPVDASAHGFEIDGMIGIVHWLMALLFVGWGAFFIYTLVRFRRKRNPAADYVGVKSHASSYLEVGVAIFEGILIIGFAVPLWAKVINEFPPEDDALIVRVVAEQFAWNIHYPGEDGMFGKRDIGLISADNPLGLDRSDPACKDDIFTINQLVLPVGKPVIIHLSSKDVIHSFGIPFMRVKHDAIPGQSIPIWFTPTRTSEEIRMEMAKEYAITGGTMPEELNGKVAIADYADGEGNVVLPRGEWITEDALTSLAAAGIRSIIAAPETPMEIACAQLCGLGHFRMRGFVNVVTPEAFQAWLDEEASYLE